MWSIKKYMVLFDRNWNGFLGKLKSTYSGFGSSLTVIGFIMILIGVVYPDNSFPYLLQFGLGSIFIIGLVCLYIARPDKVTKIDKYKDKHIPIMEINQIHPLPFKIGVVGCSSSGKTTFLNKVNFNREQLNRTNEIYAAPFKLPSRLSKDGCNLVVVDGDGKNQSQQFDIMNHVDFLVVFFDHNESNTDASVVDARLEEHEKFMEQMLFHIKKCKQLKYVHLVFNKHDLWGNSSEIAKLQTFFEKKSTELRRFGTFHFSSSFKHSNNESDCIAEVLEFTSKYLGEFNNDKT